MISVMIVDDEPLARENIMLRLMEVTGFSVCAQADNGSDAIVLAASLQPDLVFLDIQMPGADGLAVAESIKQSGKAEIVFVTAYDSHALDAFRFNALNYLSSQSMTMSSKTHWSVSAHEWRPLAQRTPPNFHNLLYHAT